MNTKTKHRRYRLNTSFILDVAGGENILHTSGGGLLYYTAPAFQLTNYYLFYPYCWFFYFVMLACLLQRSLLVYRVEIKTRFQTCQFSMSIAVWVRENYAPHQGDSRPTVHADIWKKNILNMKYAFLSLTYNISKIRDFLTNTT